MPNADDHRAESTQKCLNSLYDAVSDHHDQASPTKDRSRAQFEHALLIVLRETVDAVTLELARIAKALEGISDDTAHLSENSDRS